jgi:hypothetical protein
VPQCKMIGKKTLARWCGSHTITTWGGAHTTFGPTETMASGVWERPNPAPKAFRQQSSFVCQNQSRAGRLPVIRKAHTMPSADQLKALLKAYAQGDDEQFHSIAMQIAAGEARIGHGKLAEELRDLIDKARVRVPSSGPSAIPIVRRPPYRSGTAAEL